MNAKSKELEKLRLAKARWWVEVAQSVIREHRSTDEARRDRQWQIEDAIFAQHLEKAQNCLARLLNGEANGSEHPHLEKMEA